MEDLLARQSMAIPVPPPAEPAVPRKIPEIPRWDKIVETHDSTAALAAGLIKDLPAIASQAQKAKKVDQTILSLPLQ
ncbi:hypothetical protein FS749_010252 [Ceratobasidium sp. UAMH 11750]|nr:hypothetical protein FS749_010252 [Ceratobasidium sp. UAMH 11750]